MKISMQTMLTLYTGYLFVLPNQTEEVLLDEGRNAMRYMFGEDEKLMTQITYDTKNWNTAIAFLMPYLDMELGDDIAGMLASLIVLRDLVLSEERMKKLNRFHIDNLLASYRNLSAHIYEVAIEKYGADMVDVYPVPVDDLSLLVLPTSIPDNPPANNRFIKWLFSDEDNNPQEPI